MNGLPLTHREYQLIEAKHLVEHVAESQLEITETPTCKTKGGITARGHQVDTKKALQLLIKDFLDKSKPSQESGHLK